MMKIKYLLIECLLLIIALPVALFVAYLYALVVQPEIITFLLG